MTTTIVRELLTVLGFDLNETGFKRAEKGFQSLIGFSAELVDRTYRAGQVLFNFSKQAADAGTAAAAGGEKLGLSAEEYQEFAAAVGISGAKVENLGEGLRQFNVRAAQAARGNKTAAEAFGILGVKVTDGAGRLRPVTDLITDVAEKVANTSDPVKRAEVAFTAFGEAGSQIMPFLLQGRDGIEKLRDRARDLGAVMDNETAAKARAFGDQLYELDLATKAVEERFGLALIPTFARGVAAMTDFLIANRDLIDKGINALASGLDAVVSGFEKLASVISNNLRFLAILAGVIGLVLVPSILSFAAANIAAGAAAIWAAKGTILAWALAAAPFVLAAAAVLTLALVIEDLYVLMTGGESLIGSLFDAFLNEPASDDEHWMVTGVRQILLWIRTAITAVDEFFSGFFEEAAEIGGVWEAIKKAGEESLKYWIKLVRELGRVVADELAEFLIVGGKFIVKGVKAVAPGIVEATERRRRAYEIGQGPPLLGAGAGNINVNITGDQNVSVPVDARGVADPAEVGRLAGEAAREAAAEERRELAREIQKRKVL